SLLIFSFIGFETQEVPIAADRNVINIRLKAQSTQLNDIVVVGYGEINRRDITGSISTITSKDIEKRQAVNLEDALQGMAAGLQVATQSGEPGAESSVRIRGTGTLEGGADPLYIVDGAQGVDIQGLNPNDIESVE